MSPRLRAVLAFLVVYLVWGSTYLGMRIAVQEIPPLFGMGARFVLAGVLLAVAGRLRGEALPTKTQWRSVIVTGALFFVAGNGGVAWAISQGLPSGTAALLVATMPLWMTALARLRGERTAPAALVGLAIGFAGTALLVRPDGGAPLLSLVVAIGAGGWALGSILARTMPVPQGAMTAAGTQMIAGGVLMTTLGLLLGETVPNPLAISGSAWLAWLYLVVFGSIVGFSAYSWLLRHVAPAKAGTYAFVNPAVAVLLGAFVGEPVSATTLWAMTLVLGGVAVTIASRRPTIARPLQRKSPPNAARHAGPIGRTT
jgi:drug/metabolite transporter (DMT)-like permease